MRLLTEAEKVKFNMEKVCHICERSLDDMPPMLVKQIQTLEKTIRHYEYLNNKQLVDKYMEKL